MRWAAALVLLAFMLMTAGCWDLQQVEEQAYITGIGVDRTPEGEFKLLFQVVNPNTIAGGGVLGAITPGASIPAKSFRNYVTAGRTLYEAERAMDLLIPLALHTGHNREVVFSEAVARQGLLDVMSFFNRRVEMRKLMYVLVTQADIEEIFDLPNPIIAIPSIRLEGIIRQQHWTSFFPVVRLGDFLNWMGAEGRETHCAVVSVKPTEARTLRPYAGPGFTAAEPLLDVEVAGAALFRKDKLVGFLNQKETRGLLWVLNKVRGGPLLIRCPESDKFTSVSILRAHARVKPEISADGRLRVTIRIREEADLEETQCKLDVGEAGAIAALEALQAKTITAEVMSAVRRAQECRSDAFGFGEAFHRRYPREWRLMKENWSEDFFPAVEVEVEVDAKIRRVGLRKKPLTLAPKMLD